MSDFAIALAEAGDTSSSLRPRNLEGKVFQSVLSHQGSHGPNFIARAEIVAVASGTLSATGPPATMFIFRFRFVTTEKKAKRRFVSAKIMVEFSDRQSRGNMDPEVFAISPDGEVHLDKVALSKDAEMGVHTSVNPLNGLDLGAEWKISQTKEKKYWAKQMGIKFNNRTTFTGSDNTAIWHLVEHASKKQGIPAFFQAAVLLERRSDDKVVMKISIESEVDDLSAAKKRLFGGVVTEPVETVAISHKRFKIRDLDGADELMEGNPALDSMKTLNMHKFTGVEQRRLDTENAGKEKRAEPKQEQKGAATAENKDFHMISGSYRVVNVVEGHRLDKVDKTDDLLEKYSSTMGKPWEENISVASTHAELWTAAVGEPIADAIAEKIELAVESKRKVNLSTQCHEFLKVLGEYTAAVSSTSWTWTQLSATGSMDWIQATESFKGWRNPSSSSVLHIVGPPGTGTTVSSSHVVSLLRADVSADSILATFTAAVRADDTYSTCQITEMLVALFQQLLRRQPEAFQGCSFLCSWIMSQPKVIITQAIAWSLLRSILSAVCHPIYFIIRHFDLLSPTQAWQQALVRLSQLGKSDQPLRILVTTTQPLKYTAPESSEAIPSDSRETWKSLCRAESVDSNPSPGQAPGQEPDRPYFQISVQGEQDLSSAIESAVRDRIGLWSRESGLCLNLEMRLWPRYVFATQHTSSQWGKWTIYDHLYSTQPSLN